MSTPKKDRKLLDEVRDVMLVSIILALHQELRKDAIMQSSVNPTFNPTPSISLD